MNSDHKTGIEKVFIQELLTKTNHAAFCFSQEKLTMY